jgi:hypothetical protein
MIAYFPPIVKAATGKIRSMMQKATIHWDGRFSVI